MALQTQLGKRIARDSEAIVFEQETRKFFLAWRQVGARRYEHAQGLLLVLAVAIGILALGRRGKWVPTLRKSNPHVSRIRSTFHPHATQTARISRQHRWWNATH